MEIIEKTDGDLLSRVHEAQHRCYNSLQMVGSLARRKARETACQETHEALAYIGELAFVLGELHRQMERPGEADDLGLHVKRCQAHWQRLCSGQVKITVDAEEAMPMSGMQISSACLVVHELVMNAIKYAFPGDRRGSIAIRIEREGSNQVLLTVSDNGIGAGSASRRAATGTDTTVHGTSLVEFLVSSLGGRIETAAAKGTGHTVAARWPL